MTKRSLFTTIAAVAVLGGAALGGSPALAMINLSVDFEAVSGGGSSNLPESLQCVPYARTVSGIRLYGDAWTWWDQADGRYARGFAPKVGAVMAFRPYGKMQLGHVAAVSKIVDSRTVLLRHANWSPINGRRGQIEDDVQAVDVSPANDWSEVRVWFAPAQGLGTTHWPVAGFIYPGKAPAVRASQALIQTSRLTQSHGLTPVGAKADPIGAIIAAYGVR